MLTIIDLSRTPLSAPYISVDFEKSVNQTLERNGRVLVFFNRRGAYRAFVCKDCSHATECPRCDLSLALHTSPNSRLICHHCGYSEEIPSSCKKCGGVNLVGIGVGIQTFETELRKVFPEILLMRMDSDASKSTKQGIEAMKNAKLILSTSLYHRTDPGDFDLVVFPCLDAELVANEYGIEEYVYENIRYAAKNAGEVLVQTYSPASPLVKDLSEGNYRQFLTRILAERKRFSYPPYAEIAYVSVSERNIDRVKESIARLWNKLAIAKEELAADIEMYDSIPLVKRADEWVGRIVIKGQDVLTVLETLRVEIVRNRNIRLEWK